MKKVTIFLTAAVIIAALGCGGGKQKTHGNGKMLERIEDHGEGGEVTTFEYDGKNRIVKKYSDQSPDWTITYRRNGSVKITDDTYWEADFVRKGNTLVNNTWGDNNAGVETITLDKDGYITSIERTNSNNSGWKQVINFQYANGNLIKKVTTNSSNNEPDIIWVEEFKYDNKKSPFWGCQTPRWIIQYLYHWFGINNNIVEHNTNDQDIVVTYQYEYDNDGFPIKRLFHRSSQYGLDSGVDYTFTFHGGVGF